MLENLKEALQRTTHLVDEAIEHLIPKNNELENQLYDAMRYGTLAGGKRMRPLLALTSAEMFNVDPACAVRVAAAIECTHAFSLIHDDLPSFDNAKLRRNRPSVWCEFDEATAILAGDALQALAIDILGHEDTHQDARIRVALMVGLARAIGPRGMCGGQMLDMIGEKQTLDVGAITRLQKMKTGALIAFACESGAIMGRASPKHAMAMRNYAHDFGLAFQLTDDLLDATGATQDMGKQAGLDESANKSTFMKHYSVGEARAKAELLVSQAIHHLSVFENPKKQILIDLANYMLERKG
jgi:farnesyl diphosphate synthase